MFQNYINKLPFVLRNKYTLAAIVFLIYVLFFSKYNMIYQYKLRKEQNKLNAANTDLKKRIHELQKVDEDLKQNPLTIERIAREKYGMKRKDETVFFIP